MSKAILILGCGRMQIPALEIARSMGLYIIAADGNPQAEGRHLSHRFLNIDLADSASLLSAAYRIRKERRLDAVFTAGTDFSIAVALIAEALELPGHSLAAATLASDKAKMRRSFERSGVPSPPFAEINSADDIPEKIRHLPPPWVVKPVDNMGARGVQRVDEIEKFQEALEIARMYSGVKRVLVEGLIEGPEFSLDALVENNRIVPCGIADRQIRYPPHFIEMGHTIPSKLSERKQGALWNTFENGIRALGLSHGAAKGDIKFSPQGPVVCEIAARLSGGFMSGYTYPYSSGIRPIEGAIRLALGMEAEMPEPSLKLISAERALIAIDGTVSSIEGVEEALRLPGVKNFFFRAKKGDSVNFPRSNVEKVGNVIVIGSTHDQARERALCALRRIQINLSPENPSTGVYLDRETGFPPDAFDLNQDSPGGFSRYLHRLWRSNPPLPSRGSPSSPPAIYLPPPSPIRDYAGRGISEILAILVRENRITILPPPSKTISGTAILSDFWKAVVRGGLCGVRWYLDKRR